MPFLERLLRHPDDRPAILGEGGQSANYGELRRWSGLQRDQLQKAGLQRGMRVATLFRDGPAAATAFLLIAEAATCAPLNPAYQADELRFYLDDLKAQLILVQADLDSPVREVAREMGIPIWEIEAEPCFRLPVAQLPQGPARSPEVALILHTSGTTSRPKMVPLTRANLLASATNIGTTLQLRPDDRCLCPMPCFHIHGLVAGILSSLLAGGSVALPPGFVSTSFPDWLEAFQPTWVTAVPTMHQSLLEQMQRQQRRPPSRLRFMRSSSAAMPPVLLQRLEDFFGVPLVEAYGMTEASHQMTCNPLDRRKPGSVGRPYGLEVGIWAESRVTQQGPSGVGEVVIRGPNVTSGYLNQDSGWLPEGWFATGDQGYLDADGFLFLTGRLKEIINRGGEKISPREVDEVLLAHPAVAQAVTFAIPDPRLGEEVGAAVVLQPGASLSERHLRQFAAARLAHFKVPRQIVFLEAIPKGPTGKLQRIGLAQRVLPGEPVPEDVRALWQSTLNLNPLHPEDDFFLCGGDSILATILLGRAQELFGKAISLLDFSAHSRLADFPRLLREASPVQPPQAQLDQPQLNSAQQRLWFLQRLEPDSLVWLRPALLKIEAPLQAPQVQAAWLALQHRHPVLRSAYPDRDGRPQLVLEDADARFEQFSWPAQELESRLSEWIRQPLDLSRPPRRLAWIRLEEGGSVVAFVLHHILCDAWSIEVLLSEFCKLCQQLPLGPPPTDMFLRPQRSQDLDFWVDQLRDHPTELQWPDLASPGLPLPGGGSLGDCQGFELELDGDRLKQVARDWEVTPFSLLLGAYAVWLGRLCRQTHFTIGIPVAGREEVASHQAIGLFLNTLALPIRLDREQPFRVWVQDLQDQLLEALAHPHAPFEQLVERLNPPRRLGGSPLIQTLFNLHSQPRLDRGSWVTEELSLPFDATSMDLQWTVAGDFRRLRVVFPVARLRPATVRLWLDSFAYLLRKALDQPDTPWRSLPLYAPPPLRPVPSLSGPGSNLGEAGRGVDPERAAVVQTGRPTLLYGQLRRRASALARGLPRGVVAVLLEPGAAAAVAFLAIWKAGAVAATLDPAVDLSTQLKACGACLLLTDRPRPQLNFPQQQVGEDEIDDTGSLVTHPLAPAFLVFTSGSSGQPKLVVNHHGSAYSYSRGGRQPMAGRQVVAWKAALHHVDSLYEMVHGLFSGCTLAAFDKNQVLDPRGWFASLRQLKVEQMFLVPSQARSLLNYLQPTDWHLPHLQKLVLTGEKASVQLAAQLQERLPRVEIFNNYGLSESGLVEGSWYRFQARQPPAGWGWLPLGGVQAPGSLVLLDEDLQPTEQGQIFLAGPGLASGYLNSPAATAERWLPDPYSATPGQRMLATGDLACRVEGDIQLWGRLDQQVKINGSRVDLARLEAFLNAQPGVNEAHLLVDAERGLRAFWSGSASWKELARALRAEFAPAWVPQHGQSVSEWPRLEGQKLDSAALLSLPIEASPPPQADALTARVLACWGEVLKHPVVELQTSFFESGGSSLLGLELLARLEREFKLRLPVSMLFSHPTVAEQAEALAGGSIERPDWLELKPGTGPTLFIVPGRGGDYLVFDDFARLAPANLRLVVFQGLQEDWESLEALAASLVRQLESLQPKGLISLFGFSLGGKVAFEMARQLDHRRFQLILLDAFPTPDLPRWPRLTWLFQRSLFHLLSLRLLPWARWPAYLAGALGRLLGRWRRRSTPPWPPKWDYQPGFFPGRVTLFQSRFQPPGAPAPANGWSQHCSSLTVHQVLGFHNQELLKSPWLESWMHRLWALIPSEGEPQVPQGTGAHR